MRNSSQVYVLYKRYLSNKLKEGNNTYNPTHLTNLPLCVPCYFLDLVYEHKYNYMYICMYNYICVYIYIFHLTEIEEKPTKHTFTKYQSPGH